MKSLLHQLLGGSSQRGTNRGRVTERLGRYPILAIGTVQVTAQHSEAVRQCAGIGVEERLFFDRVALHYTGVAPGNVQGPASVVANLADARLALRDGAAVTTGKTAYTVPVKFLVEFALADILVNDIPQRRHTPQPSQAISRFHFTQKCTGEASRARTRISAPDAAARQSHSISYALETRPRLTNHLCHQVATSAPGKEVPSGSATLSASVARARF